MDFVAVDIETANPKLASICQFGIAEFKNGQLANEREWLVDPKDYFHGINVRVHGVHEVDVQGQPTWARLYPEIRELLSGKIVATYTAFDRNSLLRVCEKYQTERIEYTWIDSARMARRVWPEYSQTGYGLADVAMKLGIKFKHHNAREDARATGEIVIRAVEHSGIPWSEWLIGFTGSITNHSSADFQSLKRKGNADGILFGEVIGFTGALSITRSEAADLAAKAGCAVSPGVTKRTTLLVVGDQDITKLAGHTKSLKHRKAEEFIANGQSIRILGETDFLDLLASAKA